MAKPKKEKVVEPEEVKDETVVPTPPDPVAPVPEEPKQAPKVSRKITVRLPNGNTIDFSCSAYEDEKEAERAARAFAMQNRGEVL